MNGSSVTAVSGSNVMTLTVNGSTCGSDTTVYPNKPCVEVTICTTSGETTCATIDDLLLDTGSYGLRIFKSAISGVTNGSTVLSAMTPVTNGSGADLAECVSYLDGSSQWGQVEQTYVKLGGEGSVATPIQVLDSTYSGNSTNDYCKKAEATPSDAGFNGILGVGLLAQDCGSTCVNESSNGLYYACNGSSCSLSKAPLASQVANPVSLLPTDNNGVVLELPALDAGGDSSATGYLVLGIGTESNNVPADGIVTYQADANYGMMSTYFNGHTYTESFIDSGSNGLFFQSSGISECSGWYCPSGTESFLGADFESSQTTKDINYAIPFSIGNVYTLLDSNNNVFAELGADIGDGGLIFDWGLPFFYGRNVYVGIENTSSTLGTGPYWSF